jgi:hypothetical protein
MLDREVLNMDRNTIVVVMALAAALGFAAMAQTSAGPTDAGAAGASGGKKIRIGVYDTRAIAIAWAASEYNPVKEKWAALEAAKKAGDQQKVKELEAWGPAHQRLLHFQGFGRVPVGDLLLPVRNEVARLAKEKGLAAIAMECDYTAPNAEAVDVTEALVELYKPSDRTRQVVRSMQNVKPLGLLEVADMKDTD